MSALKELLDGLAPSPLAELEARAGASDQDRDTWLAERRQGVTATELAKIMLASNREVAIADLVRQKREGDGFTGNVYTEWGKLREPVIAAELAAKHGTIAESRVFRAADNPRYLMSPDGLSLNFDEQIILDEIKTSGKPLPKGSKALAEKGYEWQMQWGCRVIGAVGCWLNVEERITVEWDDRGQPCKFAPGERSREWFPRDEVVIAQMVEVADIVLAAMDAEPAEQVIDEQVDTHAVNYLRGLAAEKEGKALKESSYRALVEAGVSQESALARVTFTPAKPGEVTVFEEPDEDRARRAKGGKALWEAHRAAQMAWEAHAVKFMSTREVVGREIAARVTVTAVKPKKETKK